MRKYLVLIALVLMLSVTNAHAETSLQEFLDAAPEIIAGHYDNYGNSDRSAFDLVLSEFDLRYGDHATWDELFAVYDTLSGFGFHSTFGMFFSYLSPRPWNLQIVSRWLEEHPTDFAAEPELTFEYYTLTAESYDFDGDDTGEWLVHMRGGNIIDFWVARRDASQPSGYLFYTLPIPYAEGSQSRTLYEGEGATLEYIGDNNSDGRIEMVFSSWAYVPASWSHATSKRLYFIGWTGEGFEELIEPAIETQAQNYGWTFSNVDHDEADELVARYFYDDNWRCNHTETHIYDWDGEHYIHTQSSTFEPTVYCDLRQAEEFVYNDNDAAAIPFYESALERFAALSGKERDSVAPFAAFAQERLVVAYALVGQMDDALRLLDDMRRLAPPENTIASALVSLPIAELNANTICRAAYEAMESNSNYGNGSANHNYRGSIVPGRIDDIWYGDNTGIAYWGGDAGCDYTRLLWQQVEMTVFPIDQSPVEILEAMNIDVDQTIMLDVNNDNVDDWLIYSSLLAYPYLLLLSQGDVFQPHETLSYGQISSAGIAVALPNGAEAWLVLGTVETRGCRNARGDEIVDTVQQLELWQYTDSGFWSIPELAWCGETLPEWTPTEQVALWRRIRQGPKEVVYKPTTLIWNADSGMYQFQAENPAQDDTFQQIIELRQLIYARHEFNQALELADALRSEIETSEVVYFRAVALEMLGRDDEAQQSYHYVIELDANSIYADLAALWLEE
jgi:tetratricopeptide (TPR) repeat protein